MYIFHERYLRLISNEKVSSFEDLLEKDHSFHIHHKNLQKLAIDLFKVHTKTSPEVKQEVFLFKEHGNYNSNSNCEIKKIL